MVVVVNSQPRFDATGSPGAHGWPGSSGEDQVPHPQSFPNPQGPQGDPAWQNPPVAPGGGYGPPGMYQQPGGGFSGGGHHGPQKSKAPIIIGIVVALLLVLGVGGFFGIKALSSDSDSDSGGGDKKASSKEFRPDVQEDVFSVRLDEALASQVKAETEEGSFSIGFLPKEPQEEASADYSYVTVRVSEPSAPESSVDALYDSILYEYEQREARKKGQANIEDVELEELKIGKYKTASLMYHDTGFEAAGQTYSGFYKTQTTAVAAPDWTVDVVCSSIGKDTKLIEKLCDSVIKNLTIYEPTEALLAEREQIRESSGAGS